LVVVLVVDVVAVVVFVDVLGDVDVAVVVIIQASVVTKLERCKNGVYPLVTIVAVVLAFTVNMNVAAKGYSNGVVGDPEISGVVRAFDPIPLWSKDPTKRDTPTCA
jgi:hypothetical protein